MPQEPKILPAPLRLISDGNKAFPVLEVVNIGGAPLFQVFGDGSVKFHKEVGLNGSNPIGKGAALSAPVVAASGFTHIAPGVDDFAIQGITSATPFGFVTADEGNSVLKVLKNAILRIEQLEARLKDVGIIA